MDYLGTRKALSFETCLSSSSSERHTCGAVPHGRETDRDRRKRSAVKQSAKETGEERERNTNNV